MTHCINCGLLMPQSDDFWPKKCTGQETAAGWQEGCLHEMWERINPIVTILQPVFEGDHLGLAIARRADNGGWALLAGHVNPRETSEEAVVREFGEETGIERQPGAARYFMSQYNPHGALLLCFTLPPIEMREWQKARLCEENLEFGVMWSRRDKSLCFPLHQELVETYYDALL